MVFRPRQVSGRLGAVTVSRLDLDLDHPTGHDAEVLSGLRWQANLSDVEAQGALTEALDVERVTRQFYLCLRSHFEALELEVMAAARLCRPLSGAGRDRRLSRRRTDRQAVADWPRIAALYGPGGDAP